MMIIVLIEWLKYENNKKNDFKGINGKAFIFKGKTAPTNFIDFKGPVHILKSIYSGDIALEDVEKDKKNLKQN